MEERVGKERKVGEEEGRASLPNHIRRRLAPNIISAETANTRVVRDVSLDSAEIPELRPCLYIACRVHSKSQPPF